MQGNDPTDLDGGKDSDVLDFVILEEIEGEMKKQRNSSGCCIAILSLGSSLLAISWGLFKLS